MSSPWLSYWNNSPTLYTCARHRDAHDFDIAFSIVRMLPDAQSVVLDFGCGEATRAHFVANRCRKLYLMDGAERVRARLKARYVARPDIEVLDEDWPARLASGSIDLITLNSVVQYLRQEQLASLLHQLRSILKPEGRIVISDVIPPSLSPLEDAFELMKFAYTEGFVPDAALGLIRTMFSNYTRMRRIARLSKYSESAFFQIMREAGYDATRVAQNVGHNQRRMTFVATLHGVGVQAANPLMDAAE